jgi:hypothetical protein
MRVDIPSAPAGEDAMSVSLTRRSEWLAAQEFNGQSDYVDLSSSDGFISSSPPMRRMPSSPTAMV